jgi:hypothetical protein
MASAPALLLDIASSIFFLFLKYVADVLLVFAEMPLCKRIKRRQH